MANRKRRKTAAEEPRPRTDYILTDVEYQISTLGNPDRDPCTYIPPNDNGLRSGYYTHAGIVRELRRTANSLKREAIQPCNAGEVIKLAERLYFIADMVE